MASVLARIFILHMHPFIRLFLIIVTCSLIIMVNFPLTLSWSTNANQFNEYMHVIY